jgi:hypothetical protein
MNRRRLGTSDEEWGPIYGPQCLLTNRMADLLGHPIAVVGEECHRLKVVRRDCKRPIEARDFHSVVGYGQKYYRPWNC